VIEPLLSKNEALSSNPRTAPKKQKKKTIEPFIKKANVSVNIVTTHRHSGHSIGRLVDKGLQTGVIPVTYSR
jgi:hypothetical protein